MIDGMELRDRLITVQELADYLGVPVATIYQWRSAEQDPMGFALGDMFVTDGARSRPGSRRSWRSPIGEAARTILDGAMSSNDIELVRDHPRSSGQDSAAFRPVARCYGVR